MSLHSNTRLELELELATPASIGWHDPSKQDPLGLRASVIKGIWRWWCRACIGGAMYDRGLLRGTQGGDVFLKPTRNEIEAISYLVSEILGLGGSSGASRFTIHVYAEGGAPQVHDLTRLSRELHRVRLLTLGGKSLIRGYRDKRIEGLNRGSRFRLVVSKRISMHGYAEDLALKILYLALQLTGVGKGSRRGLGSLDILGQGVQDISKLLKEVYDGCVDIVDKYGNKCAKNLSPGQEVGIPPMPVLSKNIYQNINITRIHRVGGVDFEMIHNFFLRSERCRVLHCEEGYEDDLRRELTAWVLGLPRTQRGTGYIIESSEISRRASPIIVSYHSRNNIFGSGAFISTFISGDWPRSIKWRGDRFEHKSVDLQTLIKAYSTAINELEKYLSSVRARVTSVWPSSGG